MDQQVPLAQPSNPEGGSQEPSSSDGVVVVPVAQPSNREGGSQEPSSGAGVAVSAADPAPPAATSQVRFHHTDLTPAEAKLLAQLDQDGNGEISLHELLVLKEEELRKGKEVKWLHKIILIFTVIGLVMLLANLGLTYVAVMLSKDLKVDSDGLMLTTSGEEVRVANSDMKVVNGTLVGRDDEQCTDGVCTVAAQQAPPKEKALSSTAPDDALQALQRITLRSPSGSTFTVQITGFSRTRQSSSRCGSVVTFRTTDGPFTMDDMDIIASPQLKEAFVQAGFAWSEDLTTTGGRRLSEGHTIVGLFQHFQDTEWRCESFQQPLEHLMPPYQFELETRLYCIDDCESEVFPGVPLPGLVEEGPFKYIAIKERVVASAENIISIREFPSHPRLQMVEHTDLANGVTRKQVVTDNTVHSCTQKTQTMEEDWLRRFDNFYIVVIGLTEDNGRQYRRYQVSPKNASFASQEFQSMTVEYWEDSLTSEPYKYFVPLVAGTSISYFRSFRDSLSPEVEASFLNAFDVDVSACAEQFGPNATRDGVFNEHDDTLRWYRDMFQQNPYALEDINASNRPYWDRVARLVFDDDNETATPSRRMSWPSSQVVPRGAAQRKGPSPSEDPVVRVVTARAVPWRGAHRDRLNLWGDGNVTDGAEESAVERRLADDNCRIKFKVQDVEVKFCEMADPDLGIYATVTGPEVRFPAGPVQITFQMSGQVRVQILPDQLVTGQITVKLQADINLLFARCRTNLLGQLNGRTTGPDSGGAVTGQISGYLDLNMECEIWGLTVGPQVSGSIWFSFIHLGGSTGADDAVSLGGTLTLSFNVFVFSCSVTWKSAFINQQLINDATFSDPSSAPGKWTRDCACGDVIHCGPWGVRYCDNWETQEGGTCNSHPYQFIHYDWGEKVDCPAHHKRCFCKRID